jgi:Mce-associated membrane protein
VTDSEYGAAGGADTGAAGGGDDPIARLRARAAGGQAQPPSAPPVEESAVAEPPVAEPPVAEPPVAEPPVAQPPVAEVPVVEVPVAEPPVIEPLLAQPPVATAMPADAPAQRPVPERPGAGRVPTVVAGAVLAAAATALAAVISVHVSTANAVEQTRTNAVSAATGGVATVLSYDYKHLDADFASAEKLLTPSFRKQYDDTTAKAVRPLAAKYRAISSADVSAAGVVDASSTRAVVLVFVNQTVTNSQLSAPRLDRSRIDVTLVRIHGRWLIDKLTTL